MGQAAVEGSHPEDLGEAGPNAGTTDPNGIIVIVSRNGLALTKRAVRSADAQDVNCGILVIDNASEDGTQAWLRSKVGQCKHYFAQVCLPEQISLAGCWNLALKALWHGGWSHALVLNNDVEIRPDTYRMLLSHGGPFVTCVSVDSRERMGVPGDRTIEELRERERPHPDVSCFLIRKEVTDKIGWLDEKFFPAYCEDLDLHIRMHQAGIIAVCLDLPFFHYGAGTLKRANPGEQSRIRRGADRNRQYFFEKWGVRVGSPEYYALFGASTPDAQESEWRHGI